MILPQLLWRFLRHRDDPVFYRMQAADAIRWMDSKGVPQGAATSALDLGCGHGVFGGLLQSRGCRVTFADASNLLLPAYRDAPFLAVDLDRDPLESLGRHDLVVCSNVLEHLSSPRRLLDAAAGLLQPDGALYLSWTNWLSPWGGHEFSPLHYLGPSWGPRLYDAWARTPRFHTPGVNLFPTYIGRVLGWIRETGKLRIAAMAPRYYAEFAVLMRIPGLREVAAWNCALLLKRASG